MTLLPLLVVAFLVALNALYVAAEFSSVAVRRDALHRMVQQGHRGAAALLAVLEDGVALDRYIAACQVGITLSSLVAGAYAQATIAPPLGELLEAWLGLDERTAGASAAIVMLLALTALQVVLGELVPKSLALQFPEKTALATFRPTRWSVILYRAFIAVLNGSALLLLRPFGLGASGHQHVHSPEEIQLLLAESQRGGALDPEAYRRLRRGLDLSKRTVRQLMVPRSELIALEASTPGPELVRQLLASGHGRLPVYRETLDQVIGAVAVKDVVALYAERGVVPTLDQVLRPIPFVPETFRADRLVRFLQRERASKAVVVDEFGGVQGVVSIEDVLSQLFGEIRDEVKEGADEGAEPLPEGWVRVPGLTPLDELEGLVGVRWEGGSATVAGHVVERLGRLATAGERFEVDGAEVLVLDAGPNVIRALAVRPLRPSEAPASSPPRRGTE